MTNGDFPIPPIFQKSTFRLKQVGQTNEGLFFLFVSTRPHREVVIFIHSENVIYTYSLYDKETKTMVTHRGPYGDPERDEVLDVDGLEGLLTDE